MKSILIFFLSQFLFIFTFAQNFGWGNQFGQWGANQWAPGQGLNQWGQAGFNGLNQPFGGGEFGFRRERERELGGLGGLGGFGGFGGNWGGQNFGDRDDFGRFGGNNWGFGGFNRGRSRENIWK